MPKIMVPRLLVPPEGSFFLFGPRGTGKSTWLRGAFAGVPIIDLLHEARYQAYLADPDRFAGELRTYPDAGLVIVDEVQRLPALLNEVHRHMESRSMRFALCGSSARKLKQAGTNLLAGRAVRRAMYPFVPQELGDEFVLDEVLRWGSLPVVWRAPSRQEALEAYARMYLREEIQAEALVRNLPGFARFLPIAGLFHGRVLNVSSLARDAGVARTTVNGYLDVLEDTLLAFRLSAFEAHLRVRERKHPKLYWVDPGIVRAVQHRFGPPGPEERGHLFEGWVATVLRAYRDYRRLFDEWAYWAPARASKVEVDFLLRKHGETVAIEVKSAGAIARHDFRGLRALSDLGGVVRRILLYPGERDMATDDGIQVMGLPSFLEAVATGSLFPGE